MGNTTPTINVIAMILRNAVLRVIGSIGSAKVKCSSTIQKVPKVSIRPDIGCFVPFNGDYNGLVVVNLSSAAAMEIYKTYMTSMGIPENELARDDTSSEVPDTIGELTNQIMGQSLSMIEEKFDLSAYCSQPKALSLNSTITLTIDSDYRDNRRIAFSVNGHRFYMELAMETLEFITVSDPGSRGE